MEEDILLEGEEEGDNDADDVEDDEEGDGEDLVEEEGKMDEGEIKDVAIIQRDVFILRVVHVNLLVSRDLP